MLGPLQERAKESYHLIVRLPDIVRGSSLTPSFTDLKVYFNAPGNTV